MFVSKDQQIAVFGSREGHLSVVELVGKVATSTVLTISHGSHEDTSTAISVWALAAETLNLSIAVDLVVLENSQLGLLALVLDLLWGGVDLLLALLGSTTEAKDQVKGRLLLDVVVREGTTIFELLTSEDQALLVRRDSFLVLDFGLDIVDGVGRLHLKGDSLAREGLDEDLHDFLLNGLDIFHLHRRRRRRT